MDTQQMEERRAESVAPDPNHNSYTGGDWESFMVSLESGHLEI